MPAENLELRPLVDDRASKTLSEVEAAIDKLIPKENADFNGPKPTPVPVSAHKRKRLTVRASRKANRPKGPTRRQRRKRVAPR
jgi:hypothetical protein